MNRIILAPILIALLSLFPTAVPTSHGQLVGEICLADPSSTGCLASPPVFTGTVGTQLRVAVLIQGSDGLNGFDITLLANHNILKPAAAEINGTILPSSTVVDRCIGGVLIAGSICPPTDNVDTLHLALVAGPGQFLSAPVTGLLFTAVYNVTGSSSGISIGYQTGCTDSSVSGTSTCVLVANGTLTPVPETVQTASFSNSGIGEVCLATPGSTSCPSSPPVFTGTVGTQLRTSVFIQGSGALLGFDIILTADNNILRPAGADLTGTILPGSLTILAECIGGVIVIGNCIAPASGNATTLEVAAIGSGGLTTSPVSGLLFTAIYNITGSTPSTSLDYQTGCTASIEPSSVSGTTICVSIANGTPTPVPETVQAASFTNNAPDFSLTASPNNLNIPTGATGTSTITVASLNGFTGTVMLSVAVTPGTGLSCSLSTTTIAGGSGSSTLSCISSAAGLYTVAVTGTSGSLSHSVSVNYSVTSPDFSVSASPTSVATVQNAAGTSTITVAPISGFTGTIALTSTVSPTGLTCTLSASSITLGPAQTSTLSCSGTSGVYTVVVAGTNGSITHTASVTFSVQTVGIVCLTTPGSTSCPSTPVVLTGTVGSQLRVAVFIQGSDSLLGFDITLLADHTTLRPAGADLTGSVLPGPLTILATCIGGIALAGNCLPTDTIDTIHVAAVAGAGTLVPAPVTGLLFTAIYNITGVTTGITLGFQTGCSESSVSGTTICVTVANGTPNPVPETIQSATFTTTTTPTFTLSASPTSVAFMPGSFGTSIISVTALSGFNGTVSLSSTVSPAGLTCTLSPASVVLGSIQTSTLTCTGAISGTFTVTVTGASGPLSNSVALTFVVLQTLTPDFTLSASPTSITILAGAAGASMITVTPIGGFTGTVVLSLSVTPTGLTCSLSPTSISLGPSQTSTLSCAGTTGLYTVTVTGTSGLLSHVATVAFTVQGFTLSASPNSLIIGRGTSTTSTITVTPINGFTGTVNLSVSISPAARKGPTATLASPSLTVTSGPASELLTINAPKGGTLGTYTITITGTSGSITTTTTITVTLTK